MNAYALTYTALAAVLLQVASGTECACATSNVNIRDGPGTGYSNVGVLNTDICLPYTGVSQSSGGYVWAKVEYNNQHKWIASNWLTISSCLTNVCVCANTGLNVRSGAGTSYSVIGGLVVDECVPYKGNQAHNNNYDWSNVDDNGNNGWVASTSSNNWVTIKFCGSTCNTGAGTVPSGCPNIISRSQWEARAPKSTPTALTDVPTNVYVHHAASSGCTTQAECAAKVRGFQDYHMVDKKWNDIGYSFLVGEDGNVYEGRGWMTAGAHTSGHNTDGYGFCVIGNFESHTPNSAAQTALRRLIQCGIDLGHLSSSYELKGHRDVGTTACPGQELYDLIKTWPHYMNSAC